MLLFFHSSFILFPHCPFPFYIICLIFVLPSYAPFILFLPRSIFPKQVVCLYCHSNKREPFLLLGLGVKSYKAINSSACPQWCQLKRRKENLRSRFQMMSEFQGDLIMRDLDAPLPENVRMLKEEDIER